MSLPLPGSTGLLLLLARLLLPGASSHHPVCVLREGLGSDPRLDALAAHAVAPRDRAYRRRPLDAASGDLDQLRNRRLDVPVCGQVPAAQRPDCGLVAHPRSPAPDWCSGKRRAATDSARPRRPTAMPRAPRVVGNSASTCPLARDHSLVVQRPSRPPRRPAFSAVLDGVAPAGPRFGPFRPAFGFSGCRTPQNRGHFRCLFFVSSLNLRPNTLGLITVCPYFAFFSKNALLRVLRSAVERLFAPWCTTPDALSRLASLGARFHHGFAAFSRANRCAQPRRAQASRRSRSARSRVRDVP